MKKMSFVAVMAACALALSACGGNGELKKTAIKVGDVTVTAGDVAVMAQTQMSHGATDFDSAMMDLAKDIKKSFEYGELGKAMKIELTDEDKEQAIATRAQYASSAGGYEAYSKYLNENGSDIEFLDELFTASLYMSKVQDKVTEELKDKEVTDDELKKFYDENYLCAKHILVNKPAEGEEPAEGEKQGEELAKELLERAKNGEDFDAMIKEYSQDPGSESNPNGYVFTDGEMVESFENGVKSIKSGEFTLVESDYGYHVILRLDLPAFEDNKDKVSTTYENKRIENRVEELLKENGIESTMDEDAIKAVKQDMIGEAPKSQSNTSMSY